MKIRICFILAFACCSQFLYSQKPTKAIAPSWVEKVSVPTSSGVKASEVSDGFYFTLTDYQINVEQETEFFHFGRKIFNSTGVQNGSEIDVDYDPAYEKLIFHEISVWRNGAKIDLLDLSKLKVIQKEKDQERYLYDGSLSAIMILEDIRVGDILEYSFSKIGFNPIYNKIFFTSFYLQFSDPVDKFLVKIISDKNHPLNYKTINTTVAPEIRSVSNKIEYILDLNNLKPVTTEDFMPSYFDPYQRIYFSELNSWDQLSNWINSVFKPIVVSEDLKSLVHELTTGIIDKDDQILRLVRFVQNDIRYTGFEGGISGYKPHAPSKVLAQRFGDCKDKSWLLVNLLKAIDVEAMPVLINTEKKDKVKDLLPSANVFNHCVVKINFDKKAIWIDPTINNQGGELLNTHFPDYKLGYVINGDQSGFEEIKSVTESKTDVKEIFTLEETGNGCQYEVQTVYYGVEADYQREYFFNTSLNDIQKSFLNFYANNFPDIDTVQILGYEDDLVHNTFKTTEKYFIKELWNRNGNDSSQLVASFYPRSVYQLFRIPSSKNRKMPLALVHPSHYKQVTELHFPERYSITNSKKAFSNEGFSYKESINYYNQVCYLTYQFNSKKDAIQPDEYKKYIQDVTAITDVLDFQLQYTLDGGGSGDTNAGIWMILIYVVTTIGTVFLCYRLFNYNPDARIDGNYGYPLGGWLILLGIGLIMIPIRALVEMGESAYFDVQVWKTLDFAKLPGFLFAIEGIVSLIFLLMVLFLAYLFFKRRTSFPKLFMIVMLARLGFDLLDNTFFAKLLQVEMETADRVALVQTIIYTAIWVPYIWYSERSKGTFVETI
jgi:transglutaminase-like putative cysteine protease